MKFTQLQLIIFFMSLFIYQVEANPEIVTAELTDQYRLDFSTPPTIIEPYSLVVGTDTLVEQGYQMTIGALYLIDNADNSIELISQTLTGQPVILELDTFRFPRVQKPYGATDDFTKIVYISNDANIVINDEVDTHDVFIFDRINQQTTRIQGRKPHSGQITNVRISPAGDSIAFESQDPYFGNSTLVTNNIGNAGLVYLYDVQSTQLTTPTIELLRPSANFEGFDRGLFLSGDRIFSEEGEKLLFIVQEEELDTVRDKYYIYDLSAAKTTRIKDQSGKNFWRFYGYRSESRLLPNNHLLLGSSVNSLASEWYLYSVFNFNSDTVVRIPAGIWPVQQGQSSQGRYITFFDLPYGNSLHQFPDLLSTETGKILVLDLVTDELKPAFSVSRFAKIKQVYFGQDQFYLDCAFYYLPNADFNHYSADIMPCADGITDTNRFIQVSSDGYNLSPADIKFHHNDRYITFEANSWYLNETISDEDFTPKIFAHSLANQFQYIVERPYARDTFVVVNPFSDESITIDGAPAVDRTSETGLYLWRNPAGQMVVKAVAGNPAQKGEPTLFSGSITSGTAITGLVEFSIEADDIVSQSGVNRIDFSLNAKNPWEDRFVFRADSTQSLCIDLTAFADSLFLGPDKVRINPPYDLINQIECEAPPTAVDGKPPIDRALDQGWFIWRDNGVWHNEFVAGGTIYTYQGGVQSDQAITNVAPVSFETTGGDILTQSTNALSFELLVTGPWHDGLQFSTIDTAPSCVYLTGPTNVPIYLGPNRVVMPNGFDLNTLISCQPTVQIETQGKPSIERPVDNGIFLWTTSANNWAAEVVSGNRPRTVGVDVTSDQIITNVVPLSIEASDVVNVSSNKLFMNLNVTSPWMDGFKFRVKSSASSCVSTRNPGVPIYVGPNRVALGSSVDLTTLANCQ